MLMPAGTSESSYCPNLVTTVLIDMKLQLSHKTTSSDNGEVVGILHVSVTLIGVSYHALTYNNAQIR